MRKTIITVYVVYRISDCGQQLELDVFGTRLEAERHLTDRHRMLTGGAVSWDDAGWKIEEREFEERNSDV